MKKIQFYAIIAIVAFSIILTSCGQETDAQPTVVVEPSTAIDDVLHETWPENRQQSAGVVRFNNLVDNIEYNCEEGSDFYILDYKENKNLFLKINHGYKVCNPDKIDDSDENKLLHIKELCPKIQDDQVVRKPFKDIMDSLRLGQDRLDDFGFLSCQNNVPTEYYQCDDYVYLYREVADAAYCIDNEIVYHKTLSDYISDSQCIEGEDYTTIERWTDGVNFFFLPRFDTYIQSDSVMIIDLEGKICNPFNANEREMIYLYPLKESASTTGAWSPLAEVHGIFGNFADYVCIGDQNNVISKPFRTTSANPEHRDTKIEVFALRPFTEENSRYLDWKCDGNGMRRNVPRPRTIVDIYKDFPENCKGYYDEELDSMIVEPDYKVCNPLINEMQDVHEFCDLVYEEGSLEHNGLCVHENPYVPAVFGVCLFSLTNPETSESIEFRTQAYRLLSEEESRYISCADWDHDGETEIWGKSFKDLFTQSQNCIENIHYLFCRLGSDSDCPLSEVLVLVDEQGYLCEPLLDQIVPAYEVCPGYDYDDNEQEMCIGSQEIIAMECPGYKFKINNENMDEIRFPYGIVRIYKYTDESE